MPLVVNATFGQINGRLTELGTGRSLTGGSITVRRVADSMFVSGAIPKPDGSFRVDGLPPGRYTVHIRILGFVPLVRRDVAVATGHMVVDLGPLSLSPVVTELSAQTITAERPDVILAPDRNIYAVKNMTTASGGTAVDVLRNVPSVGVDGTNKVSLNGNSNVVVQINGRSSPLRGEQLGSFLAQLPSGTISRIEVATNPSAKSDPDGTAGIINIVLNQETGIGINGGTTAAIGTSGPSLSGNIGRQAGPWTIFMAYNISRDQRALNGSSALTNLVGAIPTFVESQMRSSTSQSAQGFTLRSAYRLTKHDELSTDVLLSGGQMARENALYSVDLDSRRDAIEVVSQFNNPTSRYLLQDYSATYRRIGNHDETEFSTELRYTNYHRNDGNTLRNVLVQADAAPELGLSPDEHNATVTDMPTWALGSDYSRLLTAHTKLESGAKATLRTTDNAFTVALRDATTPVYVPASDLASTLNYREQMGAVYSVVSHNVRKIDAQAGLRLELASTRFDLLTGKTTIRHAYGSLFPSAILAYHVSDNRQLKLSYSRRITRPSPVQLSPVAYRDQPRNVFRGNPALRPEYTDALELGLQDTHNWGSIQLTPFVRHTAHAVRYIRTVDSTGIAFATFDNVANTIYAGSNLNIVYHTGKLGIVSGVSAYQFNSDAGNIASNLSVHTFGWSARATTTWTFTPFTDGQIMANYLAPTAVEGGEQTAYEILNFALRHKLWGDRGSATLRLSDPFKLMTYGIRTQDGRIRQIAQQNFGTRGVFLVFSYNFGQTFKLRPRQEEDATPMSRPVTP